MPETISITNTNISKIFYYFNNLLFIFIFGGIGVFGFRTGRIKSFKNVEFLIDIYKYIFILLSLTLVIQKVIGYNVMINQRSQFKDQNSYEIISFSFILYIFIEDILLLGEHTIFLILLIWLRDYMKSIK